MSWVEISKEKVSSLKNSFLGLKEDVEDITKKCLAFERNAVSYSGTWVDLYFEACRNGSIFNKDEQRFKRRETYSLGTNSLTGKEEFDERWVFDQGLYDAAIKQWIIEKASEHNSYIVKIGSARATIEPYVEKFGSIESALQAVIDAVDTFEEHSGDSVSAVLASGGTGGTGVEVDDLDFGDNGTYTFDGTYFVSADGKTKYGLGELVNCFYSYMGMFTGSAIALAGIDGLTDDKYRELLKAQMGAVYNQTQAYLSKGYYSATNLENIEAMYKAAFPNGEYDRLGEQYSAILAMYGLENYINNDVNGEWFAGAAVAGLFAGAYQNADIAKEVGNGRTGSLDDKEAEKFIKEHIDKKTDDGANGNGSGDGGSGGDGSGDGGSGGDGSGDGSGGDGSGGDGSGGDGSGGENPVPMPEEVVPLVETPVPEPIEPDYTSESVDNIVEDTFYDQFSDDQALAEYRQEHVQEFEEMASRGDGSLAEYFEGVGYSEPEAEYIAENKELGLSAFLAAKQSADMLSMSTDFAKGASMDMSTFDSRFDDAPSYESLVNGDVNAFLTNPNNDPTVGAAKTTMTEAQTKYNEAVDKANQSIEEANAAKENYDKVKAEIEASAGKNTKKWSDKQIDKINDAAEDYNDKVEQATKDSTAAQEAKEALDTARENYDTARDDYLDTVRKEAANNYKEYADDVPDYNSGDTTGGTTLGDQSGDSGLPDLSGNGDSLGFGNLPSDDSGLY